MADIVSVVIPSYNSEGFISETIDSVLAQTHSAREILVVDDGSTDGTREVARRFAGVEVIQQANAGPAVARNTGAAHARGRYIAFLDHDDVWMPEKLAIQVALLKGSGRGFATCHLRYELDVEPPAWFRGPTDGTPAIGWVPSCWLIERGTWERVGAFNPEFGHGCDTDWLARFRSLGLEAAIAEECLVRYRVHSQNESGNTRAVLHSLTSLLRANLQRKREATQ